MAQDRVERFSKLTIFGRRYYFRAVAANNEIVIPASQPYNSPEGRERGIRAARRIIVNDPMFKKPE